MEFSYLGGLTMSKIQIITDSTSDLSLEILRKYNIDVVPLYVVFNKNTYKDGVDITTDVLYEKVNELGELPKTSAPTPIDFYNVFKPHIDEGKDIIYIGLSSYLSTTIQNAKLAASEFPNANIEIIDSHNLSAGIGLIVLKVVDYVNQGMDLKEIVENINNYTKKVRTYFAVDDLEYLQKGGRCSALQGFIGNMLKIRPILKVIDGKISLYQKVRGKKEKSLNTTLDYVFEDKDILDTDRLVVIHSHAPEEFGYLKTEIEKNLNIKEIISLEAGCVICSHCGPKTIGIMYSVK